ncbi:MAG: 2-hydroxychromene-2-carboxylate isomerase [Pseudomonadota bacterium]
MDDSIDYYFTATSPFAYLGQKALVEIANRNGKAISYKPVKMAGLWAVSGSVPLKDRSETRQRYRLLELQRISEQRSLELVTQPDNFPTDPQLADRCIISIGATGGNPGDFYFSVGQALWRDERQIADAEVLAELLKTTGFDPDAILDMANREKSAEIYEKNTQDAVSADAIGAPAYVYRGEVFWGQDRLDLLEAMIVSGRQPFKTK